MIAECCNSTHDRGRARRAYSLLEVVLASAICATALVPALAILRDGMATAESIDTRHLLLLYGVQTMEDRMPKIAALGASWGAGSASGNFAAQGFANLRYNTSWSDTGVGNGLMSITVTTYQDTNGSGSYNVGEPQVTLTTKVAKLQNYETRAGS
jgi:hypothetical protein